MAKRPNIECIAHYPTLPVENVADSVAFYVDQLGFEQRFWWGEPLMVAQIDQTNA